MTIRRDRNRTGRRAANAFAGSYTCPDCNADTDLTEQAPGVFLLAVQHDDTCPELKRIQRTDT